LTAEARQALIDWMEVRNQFLQKSYERTENFRRVGKTPIDLSDKRVFPFHKSTAEKLWKEALEKAGLLRFDKSTGRKTLTIHSLRKFFRTQLVKAKIPEEVINSLMGHGRQSLQQIYTKIPKEEIVKMWKEQAEPELTIFGSGTQELEKMKKKLEEKEQELKRKEEELERKLKDFRLDLEIKIEKEASVVRRIIDQLEDEKRMLKERVRELERQVEELRQCVIAILKGKTITIPFAKTDEEIFKMLKDDPEVLEYLEE